MKTKTNRIVLRFLVPIGILMTSFSAFGQNGVAINTTNAASHSSAILDVSSTTRGALLPRMTAANRAAIASPATGLTVYQTDGTKGYYYYNGTTWVRIGDVADLSGTVPVANGGTGLTTITSNGVLYGNGSSNVQATAASTADNSYLTTTTAGAAPTWTVPQVPQFISLQNTVSGITSTMANTIGGGPIWNMGTGWTPATVISYLAAAALGTSEYRTNKTITLNNLRLTGWLQNQAGSGTGNISIYLVKYALGTGTTIANNTSAGIGGTSLGLVTINMANATTSYLYDLNIGTVTLAQGDVIVPIIYNGSGSTRNLFTSGKMAWTVDLGTTLN